MMDPHASSLPFIEITPPETPPCKTTPGDRIHRSTSACAHLGPASPWPPQPNHPSPFLALPVNFPCIPDTNHNRSWRRRFGVRRQRLGAAPPHGVSPLGWASLASNRSAPTTRAKKPGLATTATCRRALVAAWSGTQGPSCGVWCDRLGWSG